MNCKLLVVEEGHYRETSPPKNAWVALNITINNIESFDENSMSYQMKFQLEMDWIDGRLNFQNLQDETENFNRVIFAIKFLQ